MDYSAWKLFIDASELGSLSKVASVYGTSQPHISRRLSDLEQNCGGKLFTRTGRGVVLTDLGQRVAPKVRAWIASTDELANDVRSSAAKPMGRVRIGSLPSTADPLMSTLYKRIKERHPGIQLVIREGQGSQIETWLEEGAVDLATLYRNGSTRYDGDTYLAETPTYLVGATGDPLLAKPNTDFSVLDNLPLVLFCRPSNWRNHLETIAAQRGIRLNVVLEADSLRIQTRIAAEGGAYGILSPYAMKTAAAYNLGASKIVSPLVSRHLTLAASRHAQMSLACQTVMQAVKELAGSRAARQKR